jgi:hypothetical protein
MTPGADPYTCAIPEARPIPVKKLLIALAFLGALVTATPSPAGPVATRVKETSTARICIWPEYFGVTWQNPHTRKLDGLAEFRVRD